MEVDVMNKQLSLDEVVRKIPNGSHIFWGGFGYQRPPMAMAHELVRQKKRDLRIYTCGSEIDLDILAGAGVVKEFELAFFAIEALGLAPNLRRRMVEKKVEIEDYSNLAMALRFLGGALNVPFMPIRSLLGTDMMIKSRFRKNKVQQLDCPFTGEKVCLVPSIKPDFSIIHAQRVDPEGNVQIDGIKGEDIEGARAGKKVIILTEEIISNEKIRSQPDLTVIPSIYVDYVVEAPWGSYPMMVTNYYDYDLTHLQFYMRQCKTEDGWDQYLKEWILEVPDHQSLIDKIGPDRLSQLKAKKPYGY